MIEALFYSKEKENTLRCRLCPHNCLIPRDKTGYCGVRRNNEGTLYSLTFGRIISAACDPVEKKPLYHFYPGTSAYSLGGFGCNLACRHCQNHDISQVRDETSFSRLHSMTPEEIVDNAQFHHCKMIAWTYNEPTIWYEYILETSKLAIKAGIKTVLITNGVINSEPLKELLPYIDAYRVDIKGFSKDFYKSLSGFPFLETVKKSAETAFNRGCHVELVSNIIPGWNDDPPQINRLIDWILDKLDESVPWHVTAYHPAYKLRETSTPAETLEKISALGKSLGLKHIYLGNVYSSTGNNTICPGCGKTVIRRFAMSMEENILKEGCCPDCSYKLKMYQG
ncbi:MAG: AmmeMemoRadiSam system radical SAM enzyme [Spirochaetaceae bacterium]|nr:AmmeMemoRadiSam system radical SAM enzyme [Spirochaetaceae bacterium]